MIIKQGKLFNKLALLLVIELINTVLVAQSNEDIIRYKFKDHSDEVNVVAFNHDGTLLATGGEDKQIHIYELKSGDEISTLKDFYFPIKDLCFVQDDNLMITSGNALKIINIKGEELKLYPAHATHVWKFDISPNGKYVAAGTYRKMTKLIDVVSGDVLKEFSGHEKSALVVGFNNTNDVLVTGSPDQQLISWNISSGEMINKWNAHAGNIYAVAFHPNGKILASCSEDKQIKLWNLKDGSYIRTLVGHDFPVVDVEFSHDGKFIVSAGYDNVVNVWHVNSGELIYTFYLQEDAINSIDITQDDQFIAVGSKDRTVFVYKFLPDVAIESMYPNEAMEFRDSKSVFDPKRKGEKKEDYEKRMLKAEKQLNEFYRKMYEQL